MCRFCSLGALCDPTRVVRAQAAPGEAKKTLLTSVAGPAVTLDDMLRVGGWRLEDATYFLLLFLSPF